jgi:uncharacterized delta-60 repeat protein
VAASTPGTPDSAFGTGGVAAGGTDVRLLGTAVQPDGKVVAVGQSGIQANATLLLERFTAAGSLDPSFGTGGIVRGPVVPGGLGTGSLGRSVAIQSDGKIVVAGKVTNSDASGTDGMLVERFNANGSLDSSFGSHGAATALAAQQADADSVAIQPDGKIIVTGSAEAAGSGGVTPRVAVARFTAAGALDSSFGTGGASVIDLGAYSVALGAAVQSDGKIVIVGSQAPGLQVPNALIARLTPSGALDSSFGTGGAFAHQYAIGAANSAFNAVAIQPNGRIVAAGAATNGNSGALAVIARFNTNGTADGSFGTGGVAYRTSATNTVVSSTIPGATGVVIAGNGDIVAGGTAGSSGLTSIAVWALSTSGAPVAGFGTGGTAVTSFGGSTTGEGNALAQAPDGTLVVAGDAKAVTGVYAGVLTRYNGFGAPAPPPSTALKATLAKLAKSYTDSAIAKHGLKVGVTCNQACTLKAKLTLSAGTARKLGLKSSFKKCHKVKGKQHCVTAHGFRAVTLGTASGKLTASGTKTITLRVKKSFITALKRSKSVSVRLGVTVTSTATKKHTTLGKSLSFKR